MDVIEVARRMEVIRGESEVGSEVWAIADERALYHKQEKNSSRVHIIEK